MRDETAEAPVSPPVTSTSRLGVLAGLGVGAVAAVVGLLPWLVTGMRLPLQNLWATPTLPQDMPIALLPFSQYLLTLLFGLLVVGWGFAGMAVRALGGLPRRTALAVGGGVLAVQLAAAVQSGVTVVSGLADRAESDVYLLAHLAVVALALLVGALTFCLLRAATRPPAVVGLTITALTFGSWLWGLVPGPSSSPGDAAVSAVVVLAWVTPVLVGAAIGWSGLATRGSVAAAAVSLVLLWFVPAASTVVSVMAGSRALLVVPGQLVEYGWDVWRLVGLTPGAVLPRLLVATAVAVVWAALVRLLLRR